MKNYRFCKLIIAAIVALSLSSCDSFLDTRPEDLRSPEQIFETYSSTQNAMFGVYSYVRGDNPYWNAPGYSTSDLDVAYTNVFTFDKGIWDSSTAQYDKWFFYYRAIREATYFLKNLDKCKDVALTGEIREQWRAEVRCLRAYYYANLMRMYGPVILLKDELVDFTAINLSRSRNTWDECVDWVVAEFDNLANNEFLPIVQEGENYLRMSQAIALAYKARVLLQSASPQFNGNPMYAGVKNPDGTRIFPTRKENEKWEKAKLAMKDVIELGYYDLVKEMDDKGEVDPYKSYKSVFTTSQNKEMIFSILEDGGGMDNALTPNSLGCWGGGYNPTQEMVDLYAMNTGRYPITGYTNRNREKPVIDQASLYSETGFSKFTHPIEKKERKTFNMYVNREPRFYVSVLYGGISWFYSKKSVQNIFVEMFKNGNNGPDASHNHYSTGYGMIKLLSPDFEANPRKNVKRELPCMRYAEILLGYAEAAIESGESEMNDSNSDLYKYWNQVRERAGLPGILSVYPEALGNPEKLRDLIRRERRVELAFEAISFFDTRRWLIAQETECNDIHGMNIRANGVRNTESYPDEYFQRTVVEKRVFTPSFYLFPIPQSALNKNHDLTQNYNW